MRRFSKAIVYISQSEDKTQMDSELRGCQDPLLTNQAIRNPLGIGVLSNRLSVSHPMTFIGCII